MAYEEAFAERIRLAFKSMKTPVKEKKMFGGLTFMVKDKMCCGIVKEELMVRVLDDRYDAALKNKAVREMDFTGKPMRGFIYVHPSGLKSETDLTRWVKEGLDYLASVPVKKPKAKQGAAKKKSAPAKKVVTKKPVKKKAVAKKAVKKKK